MFRFLIALSLLFTSITAHAQAAVPVLGPADCKYFAAVTAGSDRNSVTTFRAIDVRKYKSLSVQLVWASLTGSVDATFKVQVSNDGSNWVDKSGATFTLSGASSTDLISLTNITEAYTKFVYTHNSVSGGTLTGYCTAKG